MEVETRPHLVVGEIGHRGTASSSVIDAVPCWTHDARRRGRSALAPVNSKNMSLENTTLSGGTMRSSSSIQTTVDTLLIVYSPVSTCCGSIRTDRDALAHGPTSSGGFVEGDRDRGEVRVHVARRAAPATGQVVPTASPRRDRQESLAAPPLRERVQVAVEIGGVEGGRRVNAARRAAVRHRVRWLRCRHRRRSPRGDRPRWPPHRRRVGRRRAGPTDRARAPPVSARHRPSGFNSQPTTAGNASRVTRIRSPTMVASTVRVSSPMMVTWRMVRGYAGTGPSHTSLSPCVHVLARPVEEIPVTEPPTEPHPRRSAREDAPTEATPAAPALPRPRETRRPPRPRSPTRPRSRRRHPRRKAPRPSACFTGAGDRSPPGMEQWGACW